MQIIPTTENEKFVRMALKESIAFEENGKPVAFMLSGADYARLTQKNVASFQRFCDEVSDKAKQRGMTEEVLSNILRDES